MSATYTTAVNEMLGLFKVAWDAGAGAFNGGTVPEVRWDGIGEQGPPSGEPPWARASVRHTADAGQSSLSNVTGARRFTKRGTIAIQIFYPLKSGGGPGGNLGGLAQVAKAAYEGKATESNVWFRAVRIQEVGPDGPWYNTNVLADFEYDELV